MDATLSRFLSTNLSIAFNIIYLKRLSDFRFDAITCTDNSVRVASHDTIKYYNHNIVPTYLQQIVRPFLSCESNNIYDDDITFVF